MASRYYGIDRGKQGKGSDITEDSSTTGLDVEVAVDLAASMSKQEVLLALDAIRQRIFEDTWPPA